MKKLFRKLFAHFTFGFMPLYAVSDTEVHHIKQFKESVQELAGGPKRSYLKEMIGFESCEGEVAYIDGVKPATEAGADNALSAVTGRYSYDQRSSPTQAQLVSDILTRNDTVEGQRTHVAPREIVVGKWFHPTEKNFLEYTDPTSRKMKALMSGYWKKEDLRIINALFSATQNRGKDDGTNVTAESMPASQILADTSYDALDHKIFSAIKAKFLTQYLSGENIYAGFGPNAWKALVDNSGDRLTNQDYVDSAKYFMDGDLPTCYGVVPVVHPLFEDTTALTSLGVLGAGEAGLLGAWTEDGLVWAEFMAQTELMDGPMAAFKGQWATQVQEFANACRADDLQVVQGAILEA